MSGMLFRRQADPTPLPTPTPPPGFVAEDGRFVPFWYTRTGEIIKWSLFLGFVFIVSVFLLVGYWHAKRRVRQGKIPLGYHRWLLSRAELARVDPRYAYPQAHYTTYRPGPSDQYWAGGNYGMHAMNIPVPPPPMYDPSASARPPQYDYVGAPPPATMSKVDPAQAQYHPPEWTRRPAEGTSAGVAADVPPPAGPPPTSVARNETGRSETSNNPFARS